MWSREVLMANMSYSMEYATVYRHKDLLSIDNVTMCTVPMNSEREGGAILKEQEVAGMQDVPINMQEVPRQTVSGSS